jgi:hypothetical protein
LRTLLSVRTGLVVFLESTLTIALLSIATSHICVEADFSAGYLADSTRIRPPPNPFYKTPPPLPKVHKNPFNTPAPLVSPSIKNRQRPRTGNLFPPSQGNNESPFDSSAEDTEWMNHFGEPGPAMNNPFRQRTRVGVPQNQHFRMVSSNDGARTQKHDTSSNRDLEILGWNGTKKGAFVELQTIGGRPLLKVPKSRNPFVEQKPTGNLNQDLRAVSVGYLSSRE